MPIYNPPPITALPPVPVLTDLATFSSRTDAFINALPTFRAENNSAAAITYGNALESATSATEAAESASTATIAASTATAFTGATVWSAGSYTAGNLRYSPINFQVYRRTTTSSAGSTDPSVDTTNWALAVNPPYRHTMAMFYATSF